MAVDDLIRGALDNLKAENVDIFKRKLSTLYKIGYGLIEKESNIAITRRIIDKFGKKNAIARTADVLREIGLKGEAEELEDGYAGQGGASAAGTGGGASAAGTGGGASAAGTGDTGGSASGSSSTQMEGNIELGLEEEHQRKRLGGFTCRPGHYECSESGLRWVCEAEVTLQYRYGSWEDHKSLQHSLHFTEGGPLLDITVTAGPGSLLWNKVKVIHVKESGATFETVSKVTRFHVRILRPTFSPMGVVLKHIDGLMQRVEEFDLRVHSYLLLFHCPVNAYLTLHVYHVPNSQALIKAVEEKEKEAGSVRIHKPHEPKTSLKLKSSYNLRASCTAAITPKSLKLKNGNPTSNFFEVYVKPVEVMKHAETEIIIKLIYEKDTMWDTPIRRGDYPFREEHHQGRSELGREETYGSDEEIYECLPPESPSEEDAAGGAAV
ncbi:hypothetical protein AAFF_G00056450 [Aldrovandia affinis]|uniref:FIIND domain-containing protein n=1 Tax=Aldrovandia affinis TaxID=143900 RepID=A0AAD7R214_9TELE|nr:hypothetical protein AAFF_G00056450 [Aldrovandia affinis]